MVDLLLRLVDHVVLLVREREKVNRQFFDDFIAPAMADFELVHKDYLDSFARYRAMLADTSNELTPWHPVFASIRHDNLMSEGLRGKIWALENRELGWRSCFERFVYQLIRYLQDVPADLNEEMARRYDSERVESQLIRTTLLKELAAVIEMDLDANHRRAVSLSILDDTIGKVQRHYLGVIEAYLALKQESLTPEGARSQRVGR